MDTDQRSTSLASSLQSSLQYERTRIQSLIPCSDVTYQSKQLKQLYFACSSRRERRYIYDSAEKSKDISNYSVSIQIDLHSISKSSISQSTYLSVYPAYPTAQRQRKHDELHHSDNQHAQLQELDLLILTKPITLPLETHSISCSKPLTTQSSKQLLHPD